MESKAKRTVVKSAPELWEMASSVPRLEAWMAELIGGEHRVAVEVTDSTAERILIWQSTSPGADAKIAIELSESGFGTEVRIRAQHSRAEPGVAERALDSMLDEIGSPERRPFAP